MRSTGGEPGVNRGSTGGQPGFSLHRPTSGASTSATGFASSLTVANFSAFFVGVYFALIFIFGVRPRLRQPPMPFASQQGPTRRHRFRLNRAPHTLSPFQVNTSTLDALT